MISALAGVAGMSGAGMGGGTVGSAGFGRWLDQELARLNSTQAAAASASTSFLAGHGSVDQVVIASEKANFQMDVAVEVRNQVLSAYQNVMSMQI